jgi:hypothetical protein
MSASLILLDTNVVSEPLKPGGGVKVGARTASGNKSGA